MFGALDRARVRYRAAGEIIGWELGYPDPFAWLRRAFMNSPEHRAIILGDWTGLCAGVVVDQGRVIITVLFDR